MDKKMVCLSHQSALLFWRRHDLSPSGGIRRTRLRSVRRGTSALTVIKPLVRHASPTTGRVFGARPDDSLLACLTDLQIDELPLHVMVGARTMQRCSESLVTHYYERPLPAGSLCRIGPGVYVASPELTLCQMATCLPAIDLLELCLEFCGGYALNPDSERGFDDRPPLTNVNKLAAFVERFGGRQGAKKIRPLLRYVIDDSASPMESVTLMLLCLPTKLGGHQLPLPQHNVKIEITERARSHTSRRYLVCDLYWKDYRLDVECDSTAYHSSKQQLGVDSNRRIVLDAMHYAYVGVTTWQLEDADQFLDVVQAIRRAMGLKLRGTSERVKARREALREYLTTPQGKRKPLKMG